MGRRIVAALFACLALPCAAERTYAIISLVGDRIEIIQHSPVVGSSIDQNRKDELVPSQGAIDKAVLAAADNAVRKSDPASKPVLLLANDPALYRAQDKMLDDEAGATVLLERLRPMLAEIHASHLLLFTKYRHEARFPIGNSLVGSGMIEGVGFYVDRVLVTRVAGSGDTSRGFLAPFAYFQVWLIDLATSTVVKNRTMLGRTARSAARGESGEAWDALTDAQKVTLLVRILRSEAFNATTEVIAP
ncbi:MAG: hypothetical protein WA190_05290 [Usitatibacter sp.]